MTSLSEIIALLHQFEGISRKFVLPKILARLRKESYHGGLPHSLGEDSAAISTDSDEIILLTTDSIIEELCLKHPHAAGFNVVLANVMDIYAAGGRPTSFAVAMSYSDPKIGEQLLEGLIAGSRTFQVPIVRGHTNSQSSSTYVVGSATGTVSKHDMLTAGGAKPGDHLVLIFDKTGARGKSYPLGWDAVTGKSADAVVKRLSIMQSLAKAHLLNASKDISVAGVIGTVGMMLEYSGIGGVVDLGLINTSRPQSIPLTDWLRMFISLGFLVAVPPGNLAQTTAIAKEHDMSATVIGNTDMGTSLRLKQGDDLAVMFDYSSGPVLTPRENNR